MPVYHNLTATTPDDPAYEIRPSHWNSEHAVSLTHASEISAAFSNDPSYNVSFTTIAGNKVVASANVTAAPSPVNVTGANGSSVNAQTIAFSNSNGLTLGVSTAANGATVTGSYTVPNTAGLLSAVNVSAGTTSNNLSALTFANSNGITFGLNASTLTASHNGLTTARASNDAIGLNTAQSNVTWTANSSGLSLDARGYAGTGTSVSGGAAVTLNSNGLAFNGNSLAGTSSGFTGANISASITHNTAGLALSMSVAAAGGAASQTLYATGNTTVNSSGTMALSSVLMRGYGIVSLGTSNGSILVSTPDGTDISPLSVGFSTGGNTAGDTGLVSQRVVLAGGANITLSGSTNAGSMTVSIVGGAGGGFSAGVSGGNTSGDTGATGTRVVFAGGNNITLSQSTNANGATVTISGANAGGAQTGISGIVVSNTTYTSGTVTFQNANGISFGSSGANGISASYTVPTQTNQTGGIYAVGNTTGQSSSSTYDARTLSVDGAGIVSAGWSNGTLRISATQSGQAFSAPGGSSAFQTLTFVNSNGVSWTNTNGSVAASVATNYAASDHSHGNPQLNLTNLSGTTASNSAGFTLSLSAAAPGGGGVTPVVSAANGSYSFTTLSLSNANGISFGTSAGSAVTASYTVPSVTQYFSNTATTFNGANISGSMTHNTDGLQLSLSVAAPGAAAENNNINLLGANTAGNTTASGSTIGWSGQNITLSGTNGSQVVISAPATSSLVGVSGVSVSTNGSTISVYDNVTLSGFLEGILDRELLAAQVGNAQVFVQPLRLRNHIQFDEIVQPINFSNASNSSNSATLSLHVGFYTRNASTLSLITSTSSSYAITASGTVGSYSIYGGPREYPIAFTTTMTKGDYFIAFLSRTTTGGGAGMSWSNFVASNINNAYSGRFSSANNATNQWVIGMGSFNTTSTALPNSIGLSQINGSAAANLRPVIFKLASADLN